VSRDNVVIRTFATQEIAELAQSVLQANGIRSAVLRDDAGGMLPAMSLGSEIRLAVAAEDVEAALEILGAGDG
jgi:hypothetical protein